MGTRETIEVRVYTARGLRSVSRYETAGEAESFVEQAKRNPRNIVFVTQRVGYDQLV